MAKKETVPALKPETTNFAVPYSPVFAVIATVATFFLAQIFAVIVISIYGGLRGWNQDQLVHWSNTSVFAQFFTILLADGSAAALLLWLLKRKDATFRTLGLVRARAKDALYAIAGFGVYFPLLIAATQLLSAGFPSLNIDQKQDIGFNTNTTGWPLLVIFVSLVVIPPIVEELLFRGFLYGSLRRKLKFIPAALITSVLFGIAHLQAGDGKPLLWIAGVDTFILSMVLVYLREKTGSLWASIFLHMTKNCVAFLALFVFHG